MHEAALAQAALPAPVRCLGKQLLPYSLGHELWLTRENCAILRGAIEGLPAAVLICSRTWSELKTVNSQRWLGLDMRLWQCRIRRMNLVVELKKFIDYRNNGLLEFPISDIIDGSQGSSRMAGAPFLLRLQQWLMGSPMRLSESAAWNYPAGLAKMRWATHWESEGGLKIKNAAESEFDDFLAKQLSKNS